MEKKRSFLSLSVLAFIVASGVTLFMWGAAFNWRAPHILISNIPSIEEGIFGEVVSVSDVSTLPSSSIEGAQIFAFARSEAQATAFATTSGLVLLEDLKNLDAEQVVTNRSGEYSLSLKPGEWVVCVRSQSALLLHMCRSLVVEAKKAGNVSFYFGEGSSVYCKDIVCKEHDF